MDKTMQNQLTKHLVDNQLITHQHHGGVRGSSTTTALVTLLDTWASNLEDGVDTATLLIDQSAAYDMVEHTILLQKLKLLGLDKNSLQLMQTYLSSRQQAVTVEGHTSPFLHCHKLSVVQGSGLSCLLYLTYTLDLPHIFTNEMNTPKQDSTNRTTPDSILYIDDTTVNICKQPNQTLQQSLNQTRSTIKNYMEMNKLVMNNDKTQIMIMSNHPDHHKGIYIPAKPKNVEHSPYIKLLGIEISSDLKWSHFLKGSKMSIYNQLNSRVNALKILKKQHLSAP